MRTLSCTPVPEGVLPLWIPQKGISEILTVASNAYRRNLDKRRLQSLQKGSAREVKSPNSREGKKGDGDNTTKQGCKGKKETIKVLPII